MRINTFKILWLAGVLTFSGAAMMNLTWRGFNIWKIYPSSSIKLIFRTFNLPLELIFKEGHPTVGFLSFLTITGIILAAASALCIKHIFSPKKSNKWINVLYILSGLLMVVNAYAAYINSGLHYNVPFEYTSRIALPFICFFISTSNLKQQDQEKMLLKILPAIIAFTFLAHGLYALRLFPIPDDFLIMTTNILKTRRFTIFNFLYVAGIMDILLFIGIFIRPIRKYFIVYAIIWGFLTTFARLVAYYDPNNIEMYLLLWVPEFLVRSGHYLLPIALLQLVNNQK